MFKIAVLSFANILANHPIKKGMFWDTKKHFTEQSMILALLVHCFLHLVATQVQVIPQCAEFLILITTELWCLEGVVAHHVCLAKCHSLSNFDSGPLKDTFSNKQSRHISVTSHPITALTSICLNAHERQPPCGKEIHWRWKRGKNWGLSDDIKRISGWNKCVGMVLFVWKRCWWLLYWF